MTTAYISIRLIADRIGLDPWDVCLNELRQFVHRNESRPTSRFWFGSPCRFIRRVDILVHVWLPAAIIDRHPIWACYLRSTSPRWGKSFRTHSEL